MMSISLIGTLDHLSASVFQLKFILSSSQSCSLIPISLQEAATVMSGVWILKHLLNFTEWPMHLKSNCCFIEMWRKHLAAFWIFICICNIIFCWGTAMAFKFLKFSLTKNRVEKPKFWDEINHPDVIQNTFGYVVIAKRTYPGLIRTLKAFCISIYLLFKIGKSCNQQYMHDQPSCVYVQNDSKIYLKINSLVLSIKIRR